MDIRDIKDLIAMINNSDIETIEIEKNDIRIMITKGNHSSSNSSSSEPKVEKQVVKQEIPQLKEDISIIDDQSYIVKSPMVGTFYGSSSPDSPAFVKVGDRIEKGQIICIIEAMKIMNEIEADVTGEVLDILVNNEDVVEYGQPLMKVRI